MIFKAARENGMMAAKIIYAAILVVALGICARWGTVQQEIIIVLIWLGGAVVLRSLERRKPRGQ